MICTLTRKGLIPFQKYSKHQKYIGLISIKDLNNNQALLNKCLNSNGDFNLLEKDSKYYFGLLNIRSINDIGKIISKVGIILSNNLFIIINIDEKNKVNELFEKIISNITSDYTTDHYFSSFIKEIVDNSFNKLEYIENKIVNIEQELFEKEIYKNLNRVIFNTKRELVNLKRYYEYISSFISIIANKKSFPFLNHDISILERLAKQTEYLIQNTIHLREIYQSYLDYYQNRVIKVLTVITSIFLPLTLITSWYGMNLKYMPEVNYEYTYPIVIVTCLVVIGIFLIIFKNKKII